MAYFCGSFRFGHYVNDPCRLFVAFNVTEGIAGAVNNGISFDGDAEREVVVLRCLFVSPTETGKNKTEDEYEENDTPEIDPLVMNLARAFRWQTLIDKGHFSNVNELANAIGKDSAYVARVLRLTLLAPEIVHSILTGNLPDNFSVDSLKQALPMLWSEQKKLLGIE